MSEPAVVTGSATIVAVKNRAARQGRWDAAML